MMASKVLVKLGTSTGYENIRFKIRWNCLNLK